MKEIKEKKPKAPKKLSLMPSGIYQAKLNDVKHGQSSTGRKMLILQWEISKGNYAGRKIKSFIILDSNMADRISEVIISHMGFESEDTQINELIGHECRIQIEKKNTNFGTINSVEYYHSMYRELED